MTGGPSEIDRMLDRLKEIKGGAANTAGADADSRSRVERTDPGVDGAARPDGEYDPEDWRAYLPFEQAYPNQREGIERAIETGYDGGFTVVEGACGSGKTLMSLLAGISLVRDPDSKYERVFVVTSVKQQLQQFESDLRAINRASAMEPVRGVTLVGKSEMCPYVHEPESRIAPGNVSAACADVREETRDRITSADPMTIVSRAERESPKLDTGEVRAPYGKELPSDGCAFYAKYLAMADDEEELPFSFEHAPDHVADPETVRGWATEHGFCPHSLMADLQEDADVIVGNYYHVFSPATRRLTEAFVDDDTFLVVDEAHMVEERVRDLFETTIGTRRIDTALGEIEQVVDEITEDGPLADAKRDEFRETGFSADDLRETRAFLRWIRKRVDARVNRRLERNHGDWKTKWNALPESVEIELRDPGSPGPDELSKWSEVAGYGTADWKRVAPLGEAVEEYLTPEDGHEEVNVALPGVGLALERWHECDHTRYFREIELRRREQPAADVRDWDDVYNGKLVLCNCLPTTELAEVLDEFGGGILMSATLAPLSVFREVVGLAELVRPVSECRYPLRFPPENRESLAVATTPFTRKNKGEKAVREEYADVIRTVARSSGSVLICMPSYAEAAWAGDVLEGVDKPVLVDESASNAETQRLKRRFFAGGDRVLVTSARGTLTEGVDYAGDRLSAALVCSVPFVAIGPRARAIVAAYGDAFGEEVGFEYALTVPAVRKARQALGRVVRGPDEIGLRVLADARYATEGRWNSARGYLSPAEREEYEPIEPGELAARVDRFWRERT